MGHTRKGLAEHHEPMIDNVVAVKRKEAEGQFDLFGGMGGARAPDEPGFGLDVDFSDIEWDKTYLLAQEREMLGLYVSDHPLFGIEHVLSRQDRRGASPQLTGGEHADGAIVTIGGIISGLQRKMTKQGNAWAIATVEDLARLHRVHVLPRHLPAGLHPAGRGRRRASSRVASTSARTSPGWSRWSWQVPDLSAAGTNAPVTITIPTVKVTPPLVTRLGEVLSQPPRQHRGADAAPGTPAPPRCCGSTGTG